MVFCGQCGYQLAPGNTICPRCGTPVDPDLDLTMDNPEPDNPTVASSLLYAPTQAQPGVRAPGSRLTPAHQEPLILGPDGNTYNPNAPLANDPTSMVGTPTYATPNQAPPAHPTTGMSYPGYPQQNVDNYPQQGGPYPGYNMPPGGTGYQRDDPYEAMRAELAARNRTGRVVGLLLILLGLLLIIGAMVLYVVGHTGFASVEHTIPLVNTMIIQHYPY
jgi:zinc-ribbon domain